MANNRTYKARSVAVNGVTINGVSGLTIGGVTTVVESTPDGAPGVEEIDSAWHAVSVSLTMTDVTKIAALMASTPAAGMIWHTKNASGANWSKHTLMGAGVLWTGFTFASTPDADATATMTGSMIWSDADDSFDDVLKVESDISSDPGFSRPTRLYRPNTCICYATGSVTLDHVLNFNMSMSAANLIQSAVDTDFGPTAMNVEAWGPLLFDVQFEETKEVTGTDKAQAQAAIALSEAAREDFTIKFRGRGAGADQTLTIHDPKLIDITQVFGAGYTAESLNCRQPWMDATGSPLSGVFQGAGGGEYNMFVFA